MKNWECDKKKYDVYLPQVKALLGENLIQVTPEKLDQEQCSDLYSLSLAPITIAVRLRSLTYSERFSDEFTIRYRRSSGAQTEFSKIIDGWGTYFFYGFVDHTHKSTVKWLLIDLNKFRGLVARKLFAAASKDVSCLGTISKNRDNSSSFLALNAHLWQDAIISSYGYFDAMKLAA